jgi:hypothetical protein
MIVGTPDVTYGSPGARWSLTPVDIRVSPAIANDPGIETHFLGGRAVAVHLLAAESPCLIVAGWSHPLETAGFFDGRRTVSVARNMPRLDGSGDELRTQRLSDLSRDTDAVATCAISATQFAVLLRMEPSDRMPVHGHYPLDFELLRLDGNSGVAPASVARLPLLRDLLLDDPGSVRMAISGSTTAIASAQGKILRVGILPAAGNPVIRDLNLDPAGGRLSKLTGLTVSSLRFNGPGFSVSLSAERDVDPLGRVSQGALLRLLPSGDPDPGYGEDGLWVAPLAARHQDFRCVGETSNGIAGHDTGRFVVYGLAWDGGHTPQVGDYEGLDGSFGDSGIAEADLGGQVQSSFVVSDADHIYLAGRSDHPGQETTVAVVRFATATGARDAGFGGAGTAMIRLEEPSLEPGGLLLSPAVHRPRQPRSPARLLIAVTRSTAGIDCDRLPFLVTLDPATGQPMAAEGYGAVATVSRVGRPALVEPDGSVLMTYRVTDTSGRYMPGQATSLTLRRIDATGVRRGLTKIDPGVGPVMPLRLTRLADGSMLVSGTGWIAKLTPKLDLDTNFGTAGIATPKPGVSSDALVLGEQSDGNIMVDVISAGSHELCRLTPDGEVRQDYGTGGFAGVYGFTHFLQPGASGSQAKCFLDEDDQVIIVATTDHDPRQWGGYVTVGLRRMTTEGVIDANFGLGTPSVNKPDADQIVVLFAPSTPQTSEDYNSFRLAGMAWLGTTLYLAGTGFSGGAKYSSGGLQITLPEYSGLVVTRWSQDGRTDPTVAGGFQEYGFDPNLYWYATSLQKESRSSLLIFGGGGTPWEVTTTFADGTKNVDHLARQPGPALFRISHPTGLDTTFGDGGAAVIRMPDLVPSVLDGQISSTGDRVTLAFADLIEYQRGPYRSTFGGAVRFM